MNTIKKNEVLLRNRDKWLHFRDPHQVIVASNLEEVRDALREVESSVKEKDWYAAGFLSYEAAPAFDPVLPSRSASGFPYLWFGLYPQPDHVELPAPVSPREILSWSPTVDRNIYTAAIEKIRDSIANGRTYQVNYTMRLQTDFDASHWGFFLHLAASQNSHAAYVDTGRYVICSASPELFFELDGNSLTCRPMKGTVRRGRTTQEDRSQAEWLKNSEKNRAENVMIVDMIRNDLGRIARIGSVHVPERFHLERYPTLWQMTSTVTAQTSASISEIFKALFPCASITGAPKISTMRIILELETTPRRIYTGTIGYISPGRKAKFNVAIRTALFDKESKKAEYGIGGGIVWDSTSTDEYAEALLKARILTEPVPEFSLIETMLWRPQSGYFLLKEHLQRLLESADYFEFPVSELTLRERLEKTAQSLDQPYRVRLLLDREGRLEIDSVPIPIEDKPIQAHLADQPVDSMNPFLFHKTTQRDVYENARASHTDCDDVLLFNGRDELTEFTIGNLVVELDGELITPPVACGLLPGTFRGHLIETGQVVERVVPLSRLGECIKIYRVNSVRQWQVVRIQ